MAGGFHSTLPEAIRVAFVARVTSKLPSALEIKGESLSYYIAHQIYILNFIQLDFNVIYWILFSIE
jgi:hypothetical protein